jgi:hypothetical protein
MIVQVDGTSECAAVGIAGEDNLDAAIWARRILPAKNVLNPADARQIEDAFQARLALVRDASGELDRLSAEQAQGSIRRPGPASINKSHLPYPEPRRIRDRDHVRFVTKQPCLICGRRPADPHHLRFTQQRALGRKVSGEFAVPLCRGHHREAHRCAYEAARWNGADPTVAARALWRATQPLPTRADVEVLCWKKLRSAISRWRSQRDIGRDEREVPESRAAILPFEGRGW